MKFFSPIKIASFALLSSASVLLAANPTYEFQWNTSTSGFSPTYVFVTAALNTPTAASTAITGFQVTTPSGVWTPTSLTGVSGPTGTSTPFWFDGTVEVTGGGSTLLFTSSADLHSTAPISVSTIGNFATYDVQLGTTSVSDTTFSENIPTSVSPSTGTWSPFTATVPETTDTLMLLAVATAGLFVIHRRQQRAV